MKKYINFVFATAIAALTVLSCVKEKETYEPGTPEETGCYGVYFPAQEASGYHIYNPTQEPKVEITVARTNTSGSITVPVETEYSEDGVFEMTPITFADGQSETTFTLSFSKAGEGKEYGASFVIKDNAYASKYSSNAIAFDFSVMRVEMRTWKEEDGKNDATFTFNVNSGFLEDQGVSLPYTLTGKIEYYEVDDIRYCHTVTDGGLWGNDKELDFRVYTKLAYRDDYTAVEVPFQSTTYKVAIEDGGPEFPVDAMDYFNYFTIANPQAALAGYDFTKFVQNYGKSYLLSYYDNHGGFYFANIYYITGSGGYWYGSPSGADVIAIGSGYLRVDYTLKAAQAGVAEEGKVPVTFTLGPDVAKAAYSFIEGELSAIQIENALAAFDPSKAESVEESGTFAFDLGKTGKYTLIVAGLDKDGKVQAETSAPIVYLAADDAEAYAVDVHGGLSTAEKYIPQGVNPEAALEGYVYGSGLVDVKMGAFTIMDLSSNYAGCVETLMKSSSVSADVLGEINGEGYIGVLSGLMPGTQYYLLVYATNGYAEDVFVFGPATTLGDPLPIYQNFTVESFDESAVLESAKDWVGTWNIYGVDYYGDTGLREYLGKSTISISDTPAVGPDADGLYDEYVDVTGLFGDLSWTADYGLDIDDTYEMDVYSGVMYTMTNKLKNDPDTYTVYLYSKGEGSAGWDYAEAFWTCFIPVMDGYYAFVDVKYGASYNFGGLGLRHNEMGWISVIYDQLLVDPEKDENGLAGMPSKKVVDAAKARFDKSLAKTAKLGLTGKKAIRAAIDDYMKEYGNTVSFSNKTIAVKGAVCPLNKADVKSVDFLGTNFVSTQKTSPVPAAKEFVF